MRIWMIAASVLMMVSCATEPVYRTEFPPPVKAPESEASSLLVVELIAYTSGQRGTAVSRMMENLPEAGFYPVVIGPGGKEITFSNYDISPNSGMVFYRENLSPGVYTLIGFRYLWLSEKDMTLMPPQHQYFDGQRAAPWQQTKLLALRRVVPIYLKPGTVESLGRYTIYYTHLGADEDPYRLEGWRYRRTEPANKHVLSVMKHWHTANWTKWNARNAARIIR